jgi:hypothetical protein
MYPTMMMLEEWNLLPRTDERTNVRVVTIKHPPPAAEGIASDNFEVGTVLDVSPQLAILMIAAGWVRSETRSQIRRHGESSAEFNRRETADRRTAHA